MTPSSHLFAVFALALVVFMPTAGKSAPQAEAADQQFKSKGERPSLSELKRTGYQRSRFKGVIANDAGAALTGQPPQANLKEFEATIKPLLKQHCVDCHGPDVTEGNIRIDALDPDLLRGGDTDWWVEVFAVVTKGEMPPPDDIDMDETERHGSLNGCRVNCRPHPCCVASPVRILHFAV